MTFPIQLLGNEILVRFNFVRQNSIIACLRHNNVWMDSSKQKKVDRIIDKSNSEKWSVKIKIDIAQNYVYWNQSFLEFLILRNFWKFEFWQREIRFCDKFSMVKALESKWLFWMHIWFFLTIHWRKYKILNLFFLILF